jgi:replication-associated recombination protein RarA
MIHQKQKDFLKKSLELGKLPHALLFYGQEKLGKKDVAREFAKILVNNDLETNPDFILIDSKEIKIAEIRELIKKLYFKPYMAEYKVAIINNAHLMNKEAQNCFLKFLEEPADKTILILVTAYPDTLLATILSRVQKIRFYPSKDFKIDYNKEFIEDIIKLKDSDLAYRFLYAKDKAEIDLKELLDAWLSYFRIIMVSKMKGEKVDNFESYSLIKIKNIISQIQLTKVLLASTNVSSKLALEILLMKV